MARVRQERCVSVKYFAKVREITGKKEEKIEISGRMSVQEFLAKLFSKYGQQLREFVLHDNGELRQNIGILVNGSPVDRSDTGKVYVGASDVFVILPPIAGG